MDTMDTILFNFGRRWGMRLIAWPHRKELPSWPRNLRPEDEKTIRQGWEAGVRENYLRWMQRKVTFANQT